jgi:hypothetical protein
LHPQSTRTSSLFGRCEFWRVGMSRTTSRWRRKTSSTSTMMLGQLGSSSWTRSGSFCGNRQRADPLGRLSRRWGSETALEFLGRLRATSGTSFPSRRTLIRPVPQAAGASLGAHGRTDVGADGPDGASFWEVSSAIGEHRQVAREVRLTSEPPAYQCVRTRSRVRGSAAAGRRSRGQEG